MLKCFFFFTWEVKSVVFIKYRREEGVNRDTNEGDYCRLSGGNLIQRRHFGFTSLVWPGQRSHHRPAWPAVETPACWCSRTRTCGCAGEERCRLTARAPRSQSLPRDPHVLWLRLGTTAYGFQSVRGLLQVYGGHCPVSLPLHGLFLWSPASHSQCAHGHLLACGECCPMIHTWRSHD